MGTHTSTGEWQSFEGRMRYRRAERLLLRAEAAAEGGFLEEARAAIEEARELAPRLSAIAETEARVDAAAARQSEQVSAPATRHRSVWLAVAVTILFALSAAALRYWLWSWPVPDVPPSTVDAAATAPTQTPLPAPIPPLRVETTSLNPTVVEGQISILQPPVEERDQASPKNVAVSAPPATAPSQGQIPLFQSKLEESDLTPGTAAAVLEAIPPVPVGTTGPESAPVPVTETPKSVEPLAAPAAPAMSATPAAATDTSLVQAVLDRFASAYSRLDVDAAAGAWPQVNRGALSRAFEGLASQRVSLGACDVSVRGATARAACRGTATWRPKVGGGEHTDARTWTFDLAREGTDWQIVSARVQNR